MIELRARESEMLMYSLDCAIDEAAASGRIKPSGIDPAARRMFRWAMAIGAPFHIPPQLPVPVQTIVLVMDRATQARLWVASWEYPALCDSYATYHDIPIKVDDAADGRVYLVSLCPPVPSDG